MIKKEYSLSQIAAIYCTYKRLNPGTKIVHCCTCGKSINISSFDDCYNVWGHFIHRSISPYLIYHPLNSNPQCVSCNMQYNEDISKSYEKYMIYLYGKDIKNKLLDEESEYRFKTNDELFDLYEKLLHNLEGIFPELSNLFYNDKNNDSKCELNYYSNSLEQQFNTYSKTYKQDLDILTKALATEPIEYERF